MLIEPTEYWHRYVEFSSDKETFATRSATLIGLSNIDIAYLTIIQVVEMTQNVT